MASSTSNSQTDPAGAGPSARRADFDSVRPSGRRCIACGAEPADGQTLTAVLIELLRSHSSPGPRRTQGNAADFQRLDYCAACWPAAPWSSGERLLDEGQSAHPVDAYGAAPVAVWTMRVAAREKRKRTFVDDTVLTNFFLRLADDDEPVRRQFRFVLMLILMRHRKLRHEGTERAGQPGGADTWLVRLSPAMAEATATPADAVHRVLDPQMDDSQVQQVAGQLSQILQEDLDAEGSQP